MSKVVTIPKDRNPFVVIVNGVKYSYPAGVTTEVPDEVADVIEKYVGAKPKPDPNAGINFGGAQSDWNQTDSSAADFIKNKPFGDSPTGGDTIEWDVPVEDINQEELLMGNYYHLSDCTFGIDDIGEEGIRLSASSGYIILSREEFAEINSGNPDGFLMTEAFFVVPHDNFDITEMMGETFVIGKKGLYISIYALKGSIKIPGYTGFPLLEKLDAKFLPDTVILYADDSDYLHSTEDVDNTMNILSKSGLKKLFFSGKKLFIHMAAFDQAIYLTPMGANFNNSYGLLSVTSQQVVYSLYTAEYVPETTE